jgi:uncharacterized protein (DUF305 family)
MKSSRSHRVARALIIACTAAACRSVPSATPTAAPSSGATESDRAAIVRAQADSARRPYTAADIRFMSGMIGHHGQAIEMSRMAPTHGANASVRTLAERIINAQQDEIAIMQQWLRDRRQPAPAQHTAGMAMPHGDHEMLMPGMLSEAQMQQLDAARGPEFDRLFLTSMIQHHRGAVAMVKELFGTPGAAQDQSVFKLASDVNVDQSTEIARMGQMLTGMLLERRPP